MEFYPKKSLGQNFLTNPRVVQRIIDAAGLNNSGLIVEVGPGLGILTEELVKYSTKVIAIEKDRKLCEFLKKKFQAQIAAGCLKLINADALKIKPPTEPYYLIANIPYSITSPLLDHFIRDQFIARAPHGNPPQLTVLMVQKEVAQKICSAPPRMNVLALHVQTFGKPQILFYVSRNNFYPAPKVDSAVIKIEFSKTPRLKNLNTAQLKKYFEFIHRAFSQKRKMLRKTLPVQLLEKAKVDPKRRPETLSVEEWWKIAL